MRRTSDVLCLGMIMLLALGLAACGGDKEAKKKAELKPTIKAVPTMRVERTEDGLIIKRFDGDADGRPDIVKTFKEMPDPDDATVKVEKIQKMEIDVNLDGVFDVVRLYNLRGTLDEERVDTNFDGSFDLISRFDNGKLTKKEVLSEGEPAQQKILIHRYYANNKILRIERDRSGDGKIDYWEYFDDGVLTRIGRDFDGDGRADSWQRK